MSQSGRKPKPRCGILPSDAARPREISVPRVPIGLIRARAKAWRREIVQARIELADAGLNPRRRAELWQIVDVRERCLKMLVEDFPSELERIDREIEDKLRR
jgi:hypothetical protein